MTQFAKGSTLRSTLSFLERESGPEVVNAVLERLSDEDRQVIAAATPTSETRYDVVLRLWQAVDATIGAVDPKWVERSGHYSISSLGVQLYGGIIRKETPEQFIAQQVSLFRLYYHPGDMEIVAVGAGYAVTRLLGFSPVDSLFCRRLTAGWIAALELAGGKDPTAKHVRCSLEGDAFCEWEVRWRPDTGRHAAHQDR